LEEVRELSHFRTARARADSFGRAMNPYQPPYDMGAPGAPVRSPADIEHLRQVATYQRLINLAILADIIALVVLAVVPLPHALEQIIRGLLFLVVGVVSLVAEFLLVRTLHSTVVAVVCGPLMFVPCVNLLTLLVFNQQATGRLQKAGYKVGLLGGNPDDIK
jgi:hypothetical protein